MLRSMMQMFVKGSAEAVEFYKRAFNAELVCAYKNADGGYMHAELNAYGQILAVSEIADDVTIGNTMMFCFHFGGGGEDEVKKAFEILKDNAIINNPPDICDYSPCQCILTDKFGVTWCLFE